MPSYLWALLSSGSSSEASEMMMQLDQARGSSAEYRTTWISTFESLSGVSHVPFTLPFTPDMKSAFQWSLTNPEQLLEPSNQRLYSGGRKGKGGGEAKPQTLLVYFLIPKQK